MGFSLNSHTHTHDTHSHSPNEVLVVAGPFAGGTLRPRIVGFWFFLQRRLPLSAFPWCRFLWKRKPLEQCVYI